MIFTGIKDVDIIILLKLDDKDLGNICKTNTYFSKISMNESFWKIKTLGRFGKYLQKDVSKIEIYLVKYHIRTWKRYYIYLVDFLRKKYLGYMVPNITDPHILQRPVVRRYEICGPIMRDEDTKKLNDVINHNDSLFRDNIVSFIEKRSYEFSISDAKEWKIFMDHQLNKDFLNPSSIFMSIPGDEFCLEQISEETLHIIISYFLNSSDSRIHPEYFDNHMLRYLSTTSLSETFEMVLYDKRTDPNVLLDEIIHNGNFEYKYAEIILNDPRIKLEKMKYAIQSLEEGDFIYTWGLEYILKRFLEIGGTISELESIRDHMHHKHDDSVYAVIDKHIEDKKATLQQQLISRLSSKIYPDDIYRKMFALLDEMQI